MPQFAERYYERYPDESRWRRAVQGVDHSKCTLSELNTAWASQLYVKGWKFCPGHWLLVDTEGTSWQLVPEPVWRKAPPVTEPRIKSPSEAPKQRQEQLARRGQMHPIHPKEDMDGHTAS